MPESPEPRQDKDRKAMSMANLARYSEIGFIVPAAVILGLIVGRLIDHWLGTNWIYIAGVIFGAIVGFIQLIRMVMRAEKEI
jgi:F0F1-type ATP synthase assembly protein I